MSDNEKRKKSRRSSILKPPKPRNPLSDVEINPSSETTIMKSRRVSFANVRFKKEFTADPEKNTIWHTSYEEEMNKSDKSELNEIRPEQCCSTEPDMSDKDMSLDSDIMNCTQMHHLDISLESALANNSDSSISSAVIDLTKSNRNPMLANIPPSHANLIPFEEIPDSSKRQTIHFQQEDLEFTETVSANLNTNKPSRQTINFKTHPQNSDMEMTHVVASDTNYNNEFEGATMEITKSIPSHIRNQNKALYAQKRQTINFKDTEIDHMDVTQAAPVLIQENKRQTIHFGETENDDLDFTEYVPSNVVVNKKRQTINFQNDEPEGDMDFTLNIDANQQNAVKRQTIHFSRASQDSNMEMTEVIPADMLVTAQAVREDKENVYTQKDHQKLKQNRQTINFNQTSQDGNMEMTEIIPTELLVAAQAVREDKENVYTQKVHQKLKKNRQTINFNQTSQDGNMEMTEVIPTELLVAAQAVREDKKNIFAQQVRQKTKRQTINFNQTSQDANMDMTEMLITAQAVHEDKENLYTPKVHQKPTKNRQTINFNQTSQDGNMEMTEIIPTDMLLTAQAVREDKENVYTQKVHQKLKKNRQTINFNQTSQDANMDMTEVIPADMLLTAQAVREDKENVYTQKVHQKLKKNRQTINFNQTSQDANMDMTEVIPADMLLTAQAVREDKENVYTQKVHQKLKKNRQTINFNQTSQDANMDMTEVIPADMLLTAQAVREDKENVYTQKVHQKLKKNRQTINFNQTSQDANMDMTEVIPADMLLTAQAVREDKENVYTQKVHQKLKKNRQTINFNQTSQDANMEITEIIPTGMLVAAQAVREDKENIFAQHVRQKTKRQTINFNQTSQDANMEMAEVVPAEIILALACRKALPLEDKENIPFDPAFFDKTAKHNEHKNRQTMLFNETEAANMDLTENIAIQEHMNVQNACEEDNVLSNFSRKKPNRQTIHFNNPDTGNMELTESIPAYLSQKVNKQTRQAILFNNTSNDLEITQNMPANLAETIQNQKHALQTIHFNTEDTGNIQITQNIPKTMKNQKHSRQTIHFNAENTGNMEITQNISTNLAETMQNQKHSRQTIHFNTEETGNMEITQNIPANLAETMKNQKHARQTIHFNTEDTGNMEITQNIPTNLAETIKNQKHGRQTIHFNAEDTGNMEITENIPICVQSKNRQTIHFNNSNVDFTENIPTHFAQNIIKEKQNRQTIHFNSHECGNMNFTQNISSNLVQTITKANQNRQTIHFNNPDAGNMDLTENIPANLTPNLSKTKIRQTINFNQYENLDITNNIPNVIQDVKETEKSSRETININISEHITCNNQTRIENMSVTEEFGTVETEKVNYFNNPLCEKTEHTENIQELINEEALHFDTVGNTSKVQKIPTFNHSETGNFALLQNSNISMNFAQNTEKSLNVMDTFNLTKYLENTQPETTNPEVEVETEPNIHFKIFRFAGQPLILDPNSDQQNSSDICQRIKFPGQNDDLSVSKINLSDKLDFTPVQNSFNLTDNLNSIVDSTEKLINCKIDLPESEYSKIISEEIDKNYSIVNTSFPDHLEISSATETSEDGRNNHSCLDESQNKVESIISINSSIDYVDKMDDIEKWYDQITLPPEINFTFNIEEQLEKNTYDDSEFEDIIILKNIEKERGNIEEKIRKYLNFNDYLENSTFSLPKYDSNENTDDKEHDKIFYKFQEFVNRNMKKQISKDEPKSLTLLDKIKQMHNNNTLWDLIPDSEYSFTYMDETIKFDVQMEHNSEIVKQVKFYSLLEESEYKPIGRYNYKILMPKLTEEKIKSAVGARYTIFSLLDYISKVGDETLDILKEFQHIFFNIGMKLEDNSDATLIFTDFYLRLAFEVTFNLNDLHNINPNMITVKNIASTVDENALRRMIKLCPPGVQFIRKYNQYVNDYLEYTSNAEQQKRIKNV